MKKIFPFLKTVLDELLESVPGSSLKEKQQRVRAAEDYLHTMYPALSQAKGNPINYEDPAVRYAYVRCYTASHANMVTRLIQMTPELGAIFDQEHANICCIGGGPGSELVGILKYLEMANKDPWLMFWLFDRVQAWNDAWSDLKMKLQRDVSTNFVQFDVTDPDTCKNQKKYLKADLFTLVYFLSEVNRWRDDAKPYFEHLFANAKEGALFLYIDNSSSVFYNWFDDLCEESGLTTLKTDDNVRLQIPTEEQKTDLGAHFAKEFGGNPKLSGLVSYRVLQKNG